LALGLGLALGHVKAAAQSPLTANDSLQPQSPLGAFLSAPVQEHGEKKNAKEHDDHSEKHDDDDKHHEEPPDLGLRDFFTNGWDEKFEEREHKGRAPRLDLFRTRQGFLEQEMIASYGFNNQAANGNFNETQIGLTFEYAFNRRFEIDVGPYYTWRSTRGPAAAERGFESDNGVRLQLIDTADTAINFQLRVLTPSAQLEDPQTTLGFVLAGFHDLTGMGLYRVGLYGHFEYDALCGPRQQAAEFNTPAFERASGSITYAVALAKTFVEPDVKLFGDFTVFVEAFGATDLNGTYSGQTFFSFTPGVRTNLTGNEKGWWLQTGVEIPVAGPRGFNYGVRVAIFHDF
jgi:hypothetical protein